MKIYNNSVAYIKVVTAQKRNEFHKDLLVEARFIYYNEGSDPKLNKATDKAYNKYLKNLTKDKNIINIMEDLIKCE